MSHSNRENVTDLAHARLKKTSQAGGMEPKARVCADLMCARLISIYGGPVTLQSLERDTALQYTARFSCEWGDPPKTVHRTAIIRLFADGEINEVEVKDL